MPKGLNRYYGQGHLHFITCSCYRRLPLLARVHARNQAVRILGEVRAKYKFRILGYVVMPEHVHLLLSEPGVGTPSTVMQVFKQRVSRQLRGRTRPRSTRQMPLWNNPVDSMMLRSFWQRRFHDFNVFSEKKKNEKLHYMHSNPVKWKLVKHPHHWPGRATTSTGRKGLCCWKWTGRDRPL